MIRKKEREKERERERERERKEGRKRRRRRRRTIRTERETNLGKGGGLSVPLVDYRGNTKKCLLVDRKGADRCDQLRAESVLEHC